MIKKNVSKKLNLGCGTDILNNFINLDCAKLKGVDVVHDLNDKLPFKNKSFEMIVCYNVIEHIRDTEKFVDEIYRVSADNAKIIITTPHYSSCNAYIDPQHIRYFSAQTMDFFMKDHNRAYYSQTGFSKVQTKIIFEKHLYMPHLYLLEWLLNKNIKFIRFYESYLCFIFPCNTIEWTLRK